jgi:DNA invertase Pin-like site-specific DNA recombinase
MIFNSLASFEPELTIETSKRGIENAREMGIQFGTIPTIIKKQYE